MLNENDKILDEWEEKPEEFFDDVLGFEPYSKQKEITESVLNNERTAVYSCNGAGKTYLVPRIGAWFLMNHYPAIVINTAPTWRQIENQYWRHFRSCIKKANMNFGVDPLKTEFNIEEDWFALGIASNSNNVASFQGWHGENILVIFDEASGIPDVIWETLEGIITGGSNVRFLAIGNLTQNNGAFYDTMMDDRYKHIHISAYDLPNVKEKRNVIPGLSTWDWVQSMKKRYGEDSDIFRVKVLGQPPLQDSNTLIAYGDIQKAIDGVDREEYGEKEFIGLDVARYGNDRTAFVYRKGNKARVLKKIDNNNLMELAGMAVKILKEYPKAKLYIDIGMGAGVYDRLKELPAVRSRVYAVNFGGSAKDKEEYANHRAEMWGNARDWLKDAILETDEDWYQLSAPKYKITSKGQTLLESKDDMKKRGVSSPDVGDALALTFATKAEGEGGIGFSWV